MNFVRFLLAFVLLISVQFGQPAAEQPSVITIEGAAVPASALRFVAKEPLVSCRWLNENADSLNCESNPATAAYAAAAYISENAEPLEGRRDATGCCAEQRRYVRFENGQLEHGRFGTGYGESPLPLFEIGTVESFSAGMSVPKGRVAPSAVVQFTQQDAFVPLRDVALYMRMSFQVSGNKLSIGSSVGFKRTLKTLETGDVWEARVASRYFKFRGTMPKQSSNWGDPSLLIWPQGQVKRVFYIYGKTLVFLEFQDRHWEIAYWARLKLAPVWLCSPSTANAKPAGFWAALGGIDSETGRRPTISAPFSKHAACSFEMPEVNGAFRDTQFFSSLHSNGSDQPKLWLALSIFDPKNGGFSQGAARVIDPVTRRLTNQGEPQNYGFMQEKRIVGR